MSVSMAEFWRLLEESHLLSGEQIARLRADFGQMKGADSQSNAKVLSEWMVSRNVISRYQATVLSAGRSGPFYYGDYRVYDRIGEGRLSGCFRAIHGPTNHPVLLQFLTGAVTRDPDQWAAAANHAVRQASLVHPHVQRIFEPVDLVSFKFIAEEDLHGQSLEQRLAAGPLPPPEAARIARLCASGLDGLHQNGQSHGDIRPANIWLDRLGNVLLMRDPIHPAEAINFALPEAQDTLRLQGDYLAPELGVPDRAPSPQSDLYALGCVFYQMLTGQPPYAGGEATDKLRRHASEPVQPLEPRGVPQPLAQIAMYLMAKNPQVRYSQASLVAEHLAPFVDPAQLHFQPPAPAASLPAYEQWIRQKQSSVAASAKANPASSVKPAPSIVVTDGPKVSASSKTAPASAGIVDVTKEAGAASVGGGSATNRRGRKEMTPQKLAIILGSVAAVLIVGIVLLNLSGGGSANPEAIANGTNGETVVASGGDALNSGGSTTTPTNFTPSNGGTANSGNSSTNGGANSTASGDSSTDAADATSAAVAEASPKREQMVVEDDNLLWASPTTGPPLNFQYVPPGGQMFLAIRPAELLASSEGGRVLESLGPAFDSLLSDWEKQAGVKFADVEQLLFVLYDNGDAWPRMASVVRLSDGVPSVDLRGRWGNPSSQKVGSVEYFVGAGQAYFIPADEDDRVFVVGATEDIKEMASFGGAAPALRRDVEKLRRMSDADRHFTMLFAPNFLFSGGRKMFEGDRARLREPIEWFLGEGLNASMISMQFDEEAAFLEVHLATAIDQDRFQLGQQLRERLQEIPRKIEDYIVALNPHPYWRAVAFRFPLMVQFLYDYSRVGMQEDVAVINAVMPGPAAHNLVFGGSMLIETPPGQLLASNTPAATSSKKTPQTLEEALNTKTTLTFDATQLEFAVRDLAVDLKDSYPGMPFNFEIRIIGPHLEKDGITRNQQVREFNQRDQTVADIITAIVKKANPIPNVPETSHPDQKLIWVVGPNPDKPTEQIVLITTRAAAAENNYTLPAPFQLKP